ncbi:hypothetical protein DYB28_006621, partial [Aphanomyces astaci]
NLLARTEDQLDTTTKRTMMENDQMISELQYQSKETEKLLVKYKALETEVVHLRLQLKVNKDTEVEMAKRTHFYQKLIKKLNERVQSDHVAARTHAALAQGQERTKTDVNKANEDMIALLQTKSNGLETQLRTLCAELADARTHVDEARAEKHAMLAQQDDTLRFLSVAIHDITHQLALSGHGHAAPSSLHAWQAGDVIPAKLDDLAPSDVKKVLQMLFGKLHAYQAAIVSAESKRNTGASRNISTLYHHVDRTKNRPRNRREGDEDGHIGHEDGGRSSVVTTAAGRLGASVLLSTGSSRPTIKTRIVLPDAHRMSLPSAAVSPG